MMLSSVVLPEPLGPRMATKLIVTEVQADIVEGDLFQIACFVFLADFFKLKHIPAFLGNGRSRMRVSGRKPGAGGLPDARRQKNNKITVLFYQMNVNKPWIYHRKVLRG